MESEDRALLTRLTVAVEKLSEDPVIQIETGPPVCPHCERINPNVSVSEREADGPLGTFVIQAQCKHCHNTFYALPVQYHCFSTVEDLRQGLTERAAESGIG